MIYFNKNDHSINQKEMTYFQFTDTFHTRTVTNIVSVSTHSTALQYGIGTALGCD